MGDTVKHIVHISYTLARPKFTDPEVWLKKVVFTSGVVEKLLPYGPQTVVYHIHYKGELERNGVKYIFSGLKRWQLVLPFGLNRRIKKLKPDVVLCHGLIFPWQLIMLRLIAGPKLKIICQHHAERPFKDFRKCFSRWADKYIGGYLFAAKQQGEEWVRAKQISSMNKVHEVMGTSSIFHFENRRREGKKYLWIGDLDENKDPVTLVKAFVAFSKNKDVELSMIFQNDVLLEKTRPLANEKIHFVGKVEHAKLQDWFNEADFIISTSHYEGSGIAVCEALSCGCFPILTNIPSFRMMTGYGKIGRLFEAGSENDLIKALEETEGVKNSDKIIQHFNEELSFEANARKIINVIKTL